MFSGRRCTILSLVGLFYLIALFCSSSVFGDVASVSGSGVVWTERATVRQVSVARPQYSASSLLVRVSPEQSTQQLAEMLQQQTGVRVRTYERFPQHLSVTAPPQVPLEAVQQYLEQMPQVQSARPHLLVHQLQTPPNDPFFVDYVTDPTEAPNQYYLFDMNVPAAWELQKGSPDVTIAIIDSAVSMYHEDLHDNIVSGWDFVGDNVGWPGEDITHYDDNPTAWDPAWGQPEEPYPSIDDDDATRAAWWAAHYDGAVGDTVNNDEDKWGQIDAGTTHGTMVAGLAGARVNNSTGYAGISWNCSLMPVRMMSAEGIGYGIDAADAIMWAADADADVLNLSWGAGPVYAIEATDPASFEPGGEAYLIEEAINYAINKGCIIVAAAGNSDGGFPYTDYANHDGHSGGLDFPGNLTQTISVGSVDWVGDKSWFSSYADPLLGEVLDVVAPGELGWTTSFVDAGMWWQQPVWNEIFPDEPIPPEEWVPLGEDLYTADQGTSFSAPLVSGFAGLLRARYPGMTYQQFREFIQRTAVDLNFATYPGDDPYLGYGCLDAYEAILYADAHIPEPSTTALFLLGLAGLAGYRRRRRNS